MRYFILGIFLCTHVLNGFCQDVNTVQPSILIMPYVSSGGNALELFESDNSYRSCIAAIEEAFQKEGSLQMIFKKR